YHKRGAEDFVISANRHYRVKRISSKIELPIAQKAKVKALLQHDDELGQTVMVLKVMAPELSISAKTERFLAEAEVPVEFSKLALEEADIFGSKVSAKDKKKRTNLSELALCTIDGETAKDFDDAVFARQKNSSIEVTVAIADVSHYVKIGSALDEEAHLRGTSIYFPGHCVPMLPEQLSNGLCSLRPNVDRLALSVSFEIGPKGGIKHVKLKESLICSKARLTYSQVQDFYDKKLKSQKLIPKDVQKSLVMLKKAATILRKARQRRGAIDFDITESVIALDNLGEPISVNPLDRLESHKIIEDLMVAANELVAQYFQAKKIPSIFRVHESPNEEKLENFFKTAHAFGVLKGGVKTNASHVNDPKDLQKIIKTFANSDYKETLNSLLLRAMMQARYSEKNLGHFGLASKAYLHFTSPIRRYADLVVHRQLRYQLFEKKSHKKIPESKMALIAEAITQKEIKATDLERKINRLFAASFMSSRVGEVFDAVIVSCTEFGFFVRVIEHHVEGLVHIATIAKTHVHFVAEKMSLVVSGSNRIIAVGQKVKVRLINVNIDRGHIDFELAERKGSKRTSKKSRGPSKKAALKAKESSSRPVKRNKK
ncbi:MAG: VacB/RNase II family 3'-5' exoribonuclease, partial [Myxococcales bacterium]|nr:VacB/RNase II family 3'-5' exoribonuclease [Myxococcales bacterium]